MNHEVNAQGFAFQGIRRWPGINLVTLIHGHSYLISHFCRLLESKKFLRNPGQFKQVTRKTRYHISIAELLKRNLMSQVAKLIQRPKVMLKILHFSEDQQFFQKLWVIKFLYNRGKELFQSLTGRHNFIPGRPFQQYCRLGKPPGCISPGHLDRVCKYNQLQFLMRVTSPNQEILLSVHSITFLLLYYNFGRVIYSWYMFELHIVRKILFW